MYSLNSWIDSSYDGFYSDRQLLEIAGSTDVVLTISGVPIPISQLAYAGWTCRVRHNKYGGRSKFSFSSKDGRSTITFRISGRWYPGLGTFHRKEGSYTERGMFKLLVDSADVERQGILTSVPTPVPSSATDQELLDALQRNIKRRLKLRKKPTKRAVIERAIALSAAS
jgi:hypothetical protein